MSIISVISKLRIYTCDYRNSVFFVTAEKMTPFIATYRGNCTFLKQVKPTPKLTPIAKKWERFAFGPLLCEMFCSFHDRSRNSKILMIVI